MINVWWILKRELAYYLRSPMGYVILAVALFLNGLLFNVWAIGTQSRTSGQVLTEFFLHTGGVIMAASVFVTMRLIAEERQNGTLILLLTSPVSERQLVLGKFFGAFLFVALLALLTFYMPLLLVINGKVSWGHVGAGYLGVLLIASSSVALGLLCSALAPNQLVAAVSTAAIFVAFVLFWLLSRLAEPPESDMIRYLSIFDAHFRPFQRGLLTVKDVVFYLMLTYAALLVSTRVIEARRWSSAS
ncbi:MAG: ABC transporter permease [Myxococcota bacterium]